MYHRPRLIPCLTMIDRGLVKTVQFKKPRYIGDPINTIRIFNNKGVDEICILDIDATKKGSSPDFEFLQEIASEAFIPLSYGGGITTIQQIEQLLYIGFEKVIINSAFINNPDLIKEAAQLAGRQSIVVAIDVKKNLLGQQHCYYRSGSEKVNVSPLSLAKKAEAMGAGEILLTSINNEGMMSGYDLQLVSEISSSVSIPVIANGGASSIEDFYSVIKTAKAHAAAASSFFVFYGPHRAVLITTPSEEELIKIGVYQQ
jgi:imidazole glycerol-phosphate synthase subunit HisF